MRGRSWMGHSADPSEFSKLPHYLLRCFTCKLSRDSTTCPDSQIFILTRSRVDHATKKAVANLSRPFLPLNRYQTRTKYTGPRELVLAAICSLSRVPT
jgi:hypothetical protein